MVKGNKIALEKENLIYIEDEFVEEIAKTIKSELISLCWGEENMELFNYQGTVASFLDRLDERDSAFKAGFIGEFIVHCYFKIIKIFKHLSIH